MFKSAGDRVFVMHTSDEWLLDSPSPGEVANAEFQIVRRGYDPLEVQAFARRVSTELLRLGTENQALRQQVELLESRVATGLDEQSIAQFLGEETTRLLTAAHDTAAGVVSRAEQRRADDGASARRCSPHPHRGCRCHRRAAVGVGRQQQMINEASTHRRTVLTELGRRRDLACSQLSDLLRGREVLVQSLAHLAGTAGDLIARLDAISAEPTDFVNLDPSIDGPGLVVDQSAVLSVTEKVRGQRGSRGKPTVCDRTGRRHRS